MAVTEKDKVGSGFASNRTDEARLSAQLTRDLMVALDLSYNQAAGVTANVLAESDRFRALEEYANNVYGTKGLGWAQWTNTPGSARRTAFEDYARAMGLPVTSYAANFGNLVRELQTTHKYALDDLRKQTTFRGATKSFVEKFEVPKGVKNGVAAEWLVDKRVAFLDDPSQKNNFKETLDRLLSGWNPPNTPATMNGKTAPTLPEFEHKPGSVADYQSRLAELGFPVGTIDGTVGKETQKAIEEYQAYVGLEVTGKLDAATKAALADPMSAREAENKSMRDLAAMEQRAREAAAFNPRDPATWGTGRGIPMATLADQLGKYQPGKGGNQQNMARPDLAELSGFVGRMPTPTEGVRLSRSPITGQQARLSEIASMRNLANMRADNLIVRTPPQGPSLFRDVGYMPAERLSRSPIIGQQARASEIKSLSDLAAMTRQNNEQRAGLASMGRASENASMASLASMQGAEASRRAEFASASRAAENKSMADLASMDRKVAENRALYAPFARAAENKSMKDLASFRQQSAMGRAAAARAAEDKSMKDLSAMRAENLVVRTPPERAIGSLPAASAPLSVPSAGVAQGRRASENLSMQNLAMDEATKGMAGSKEGSRWNVTSSLLTGADRRIAELTGKSAAARLADAYGLSGQKSRALDVIQTKAPAASMQSRVVTDPRTSLAPQRNTFNNSLQPAVPAVPPSAPATISTASPQGSRLAAGYAGYAAARGYPMGATLQPAPQPAAPLQQRAAPAPVVTQPQRQITNEPQFSGRTPGDRARSSAFQPGGIFGYTSQQARGGGGYNPTPV